MSGLFLWPDVPSLILLILPLRLPLTSYSARLILMSKLTTGVAYSVSAGEVVHGILTYFSPEEWSAVGVLAGISLATITCIINWYYRRKATLAEIRALRCTCPEEPR